MSMEEPHACAEHKPGLGAYLSPLAVIALSFGYAVGWGSFVMPGTTFLPGAGPLGTVIGILIGAVAMSVFALNYHRMILREPGPGRAFQPVRSEAGRRERKKRKAEPGRQAEAGGGAAGTRAGSGPERSGRAGCTRRSGRPSSRRSRPRPRLPRSATPRPSALPPASRLPRPPRLLSSLPASLLPAKLKAGPQAASPPPPPPRPASPRALHHGRSCFPLVKMAVRDRCNL